MIHRGDQHYWFFTLQGQGSLPRFFYTVHQFAACLILQLFLYVCVCIYCNFFFLFVGGRKLFYGLCEENLFIHMEFGVGMLCDTRCNW